MADYFGIKSVYGWKGAVYTKPPAVPCLEADYHTAAQWHLCNHCGESWLCREAHAHGHPGCPGKRYASREVTV